MLNSTPIQILVTLPFAESLLNELRETSPRVHVTAIPARRVEDIPAEIWRETEILYTDRVLPESEQAPNLRWIQFHYAGVDYAMNSPLLHKPELIVTTLSGAAAPQMAEFALLMMMAMGHHMPDLAHNQNKADWPANRWERFSPKELRGSTVGLIGYGSIGRELARMLQPFNCTILAVKRDVMHPQDYDYIPAGMGDPEGNFFTRLYPIQALGSVLKESDFVVVTLPLTPETLNVIGAAELEMMKPSAYLIQVSRGGIVNETALLSALQTHKIAGAALDVFAEEPLPSSSPFWHIPNVLVTPHLGGISPYYNERAMALFIENVRKYCSGAGLQNRVDLQRGY